jgi:hypothetical protein
MQKWRAAFDTHLSSGTELTLLLPGRDIQASNFNCAATRGHGAQGKTTYKASLEARNCIAAIIPRDDAV